MRIYAVLVLFIASSIGNSYKSFPRLSKSTFSVRNLPNYNDVPISSNSFETKKARGTIEKLISITLTVLGVSSLRPSVATADSMETVNQKLTTYGFPPILFVPKGFSPLVSEYGRGNNQEAIKNPILVQFAYPSLWVVQKTSVNNNGEAGTISANDYIKGDSAFLYVLPVKEKIETIDTSLIRNFILKALSQKGDPVESLKIYRVDETKIKGVDGQKYILVDFSYQLNTEAGFLISRRSVMSITNVGDGYLQGLVAVTTDQRWGGKGKVGLEETLRTVAESFRVYRLNSGIFSAST